MITAEETSADEYTFDTSEVQAGDEFTFVNAEDNEQIHFGLLQEYAEGTTEAEASEALQGSLSSETGEPPPGSPESEDVGGASLFEPGQGGTGEVTLSSGRGTWSSASSRTARVGRPTPSRRAWPRSSPSPRVRGMTRRIALIIAATLLVAGLAGCGDDDDEEATEDTEEEAPAEEEDGAEAGTLEITGQDFSFEAPDEVEGGIVEITFSNEGTTRHEANILGIGDTDVDQVAEDFGAVLEGGPIPEYLVGGGGFFGVDKGEEQTSTQTLPPGDYLILCSLDTNANEEEVPEGEEREPHYKRGMLLPFTVTGDEASVDDLPEADAGEIIAEETSADAYTFDVSTVKAGGTLTS